MSADETSFRKCPSCSKYSHWHGNAGDKCEFCSTLLDPQRLAEENFRSEENKKGSHVFLVTVEPDDNFIVAFFKRIAIFAQLIFMAIVSFILWVTAAVAG
ncbi:MAG: hypothetical protein M3Q97_08085 [Bacteroidota bacterium]|nr:hypothetical protein [Bacteroidota bacterium]